MFSSDCIGIGFIFSNFSLLSKSSNFLDDDFHLYLMHKAYIPLLIVLQLGLQKLLSVFEINYLPPSIPIRVNILLAFSKILSLIIEGNYLFPERSFLKFFNTIHSYMPLHTLPLCSPLVSGVEYYDKGRGCIPHLLPKYQYFP